MSRNKTERYGEIFAFGHAVCSGALPLFIVLSKDTFPPIFFTGMSFFLAGIFLLPIAIIFERDRFIPKKRVVIPMIAGVSIILFVYYPLLTFAGQHTSAGNIAILTQTEVFFSFLFFGLLGLELVTVKRVFGSLLIVAGVIAILFRNFSGEFGYWDIMIILIAATPPLANHFQKIALTGVGPLSMTVLRNIFGGVILLLISFAFEPVSFSNLNVQNFGIIILNSILAFGIAKWFIFLAYPRIGVAKAIAICALSPAFTLLLAFIFLYELPTNEQMLGLIAVTIGVLFVIHRQITRFTGKVVAGDQIGRKIGFPTINLETSAKISAGVYAVKTVLNDKNFTGVMHVGKRPTFEKMAWRTEIHLLDFTGEVPVGETVEIEILERLRGVKKFQNQEKLAEQIEQDVAKTQTLFRSPV